MKILLVLHHHLDPNAGASSVTLKLGQTYEKLGHNVHYYSYDDLPSRFFGKFSGLLFPFYVAWHIRKLSMKERIDVVHASSGDAWIWGILFSHLSLKHRPLLVTQSHGLEHTMHETFLEEAKSGRLKLSWKYPLYHGGLLLWQVATSFRTSDLCFMLNWYDAKKVKQEIRVDPEKVKIFPNGIPDNFLGLPFKNIIHKEIPVGIALVGSYIERKGIRYSIPALNNVMKRHPTLYVKLLGSGCPSDKILNDFSSEVRHRIIIVPTFRKHELPNLLEDCHILLFPSLSEGFPLALPEAMACGLAPIVTKIPGLTEIVSDGMNGIVVAPRNQRQLEGAMEHLIKDRNYLHKLRHQAYQAVQTYNWQAIAQKHLDLYAEHLGLSLKPKTKATSLSTSG
jgi:glycosyltransferase involved in cell wall biosynthesis